MDIYGYMTSVKKSLLIIVLSLVTSFLVSLMLYSEIWPAIFICPENLCVI